MQVTIIALVCCLVGSALALPYPDPEEKKDVWNERKQFNMPDEQRFLVDGGYNKDKSGKDVWVQAQVPVWTSENKRHEFDVVGKYGQHLDGPYGNSPPSWGVGGNYRFRF
ncbi:diptericin A [Drosophila grimshawi]|uniref:GH22131 n=1 Tax=Drosophila grimshawi TaxID=7222 RepID=B4J4K3_DROGR|nr:diptericin A [Drosophila grimshawi]XP_001987843.1 diptericin A [Drosophila grimshawi]EDW02708.1 GH22131 [Drosophila grimshawi]EDW02710.1 GH22133 [Drosophila grimshawi]